MSSITLLESQKDEYSILDQWIKAKEFVYVGRGINRIDALDKVLGRSKYVEDYLVEGLTFARIVKSNIPHGILESINPGKASQHPDFITLVTSKDIPGLNQVGYYIPDQPALAEKKVRFHGEPVALVVSSKPKSAEELRELVEVVIKPIRAVFDPLEALKDEVLVHEENRSNVVLKTRVRKGDSSRALQESDYVVEGTYKTGYQDHAYLETEGALAIPSDGGMTVILPGQYPHLAQAIISRVLGVSQSKVRIIQPVIGGGFGGKDDMEPIVGAQAAIAAYKIRRPVLLTYSREDSFTSHCKRDPAIIKYRSGASRDGRLTVVDVDIIFDAGAYANRGPFTLWRATVHATGPYEVPNVDVRGMLVYTNKVYQGSFRGFGNPQIQFAAERQMDELAERIGIDPLEFRLKNILKPGSKISTNQVLEDSVGIADALIKVAERCSWADKRKAYGKIVDGKARGLGLACAWHGISTSRGVPDWCNAYLNVAKDGSITIYTGVVEMGQGTHTGLLQIAAEILGVPFEKINLIGGTSDAPDTGATHGSRGASFGGISVAIAATKIRRRVQKVASRILGCSLEDVELKDGWVYNRHKPEMRITWEEAVKRCYAEGEDMAATGYFYMPKGKFDEEKGQGFAYIVFSYMVVAVEVEIDVETGLTRVVKVWPAICAGRIINPRLATTQIHGAVLQGIGYTLTEEVKLEDGRIINPNFTDYLVPTIADLPEIEEPIFVEDLFRFGPFGAKGLAEMALIPIPAAITNAIKHALGIGPSEIPCSSEKLFLEMSKAMKKTRS
ncbi:MAG: xanthine dehydrogenase family protein molybdopterin-binding subunit [Aigarchaeota archaeon]|nr:xanthine dehydrogenase family protein molybdopterin-binding subunit [Aigarchaeota archaeon]MCX8193335.1 xanthine dehydrogenase family protein molybdopterin-binding subunit [Nitrososphaeria archaeon]MDW7985865.1 xanthine dehydrogenase family protein molybdopterin-binding subunit [Nitrososphaerota archaeon]